jgi:hypothetical protein
MEVRLGRCGRNAAPDHAPLVICSPFVEADFVAMPVPSPKASQFYAPLSYYPVKATVIPLPETLNSEAIKMGRLVLNDATAHRQSFVAVGFASLSGGILNWLTTNASQNFTVLPVGDFDQVRVLEFVPR